MMFLLCFLLYGGSHTAVGTCNDVFLSDWPMLMTHDAGSGYLDTAQNPIFRFTNTQGLDTVSLTDQMNCGARSFDLRPLLLPSGELIMHHGEVPIPVPYAQAVREVLSWAADNSDEFLVVYASHFSPDTEETRKAVRDVFEQLAVEVVSDCVSLSTLTVGEAKSLGLITGTTSSVIAVVEECVEEYFQGYTQTNFCYAPTQVQMLRRVMSDFGNKCGDAFCQTMDPGSYCKSYQSDVKGRVCHQTPGLEGNPPVFCDCPSGPDPSPESCALVFAADVQNILTNPDVDAAQGIALFGQIASAGCLSWFGAFTIQQSCACYESGIPIQPVAPFCDSPDRLLDGLLDTLEVVASVGAPSKQEVEGGARGPLYLVQGHWQYNENVIARGLGYGSSIPDDTARSGLNTALLDLVDAFEHLNFLEVDDVCAGGNALLQKIEERQKDLCEL